MSTESVIKRSAEAFALLRFVRPSFEEPGKHLVGLPIRVGRIWVVLARLNDTIQFDGFEALRLVDIRDAERRFPRRTFCIRGLQRKWERLPTLPLLDLDSTHGLLRSAQKWFSLLVVDRENVNAGAAEIGKILSVTSRSYQMRLITPGAIWEKRPERYLTAEVTRVGFGGRYEETLAAVVGLTDPKWR